MRVLLTTLNAKYIHINLAVRLLHELNKQRGNIDLKEFTIKEDKAEIADYCSRYNLVAFSCYIWNITQTLEVARKIKTINPNVIILLGGPEVSYDYKNVITRKEVDFIIQGEGEIPFQEFLEYYPDVEKVHNLIYKKDNEVIENLSAKVFDLTAYRNVQPYSSDNTDELKNKVLYIETSRGCPYKCEFCLASLDNNVRYLPNETIKANLLYLMLHGKVIKFLDRTFNIKKDFTIDIFKFILANHRPGNVFQFEITADIVHPDIIEFINSTVPKGLFRFEIGIQTVNQKANLEVSRKQNFDKTKGIILALMDKVEMHLDLIVGMALDYWGDIKYSFEEVFKLYAPELQLGFLKFLKGTPIREKYKQHGFVFDENPPYQIIESNYLSKQQLEQIVKLEHALEIYWNKKRAVNTLKYVTENYSIFDFLLGLGIYFGEKRDYHKFTLIDVYEIMNTYAERNYPEDTVLRQLIALDYYLTAKVKPKALFIDEVSREEKNRIIEELHLNHHKYRYMILPMDFNVELFINENKINAENYNLILQYNGETNAEIICYTAENKLQLK